MFKCVGLSSVLISVLLSACQNIAPPQSPLTESAALQESTDETAQYPNPESVSENIPSETAVNEVEMLQEHVKLLEQNMVQLQEQIQFQV